MLNISVEPYRRRAGTRVVLRLLVALALGHTTALLVGVEQPLVGEELDAHRQRLGVVRRLLPILL